MIQTKNILDSNNVEELKAEIKTLNKMIELLKEKYAYYDQSYDELMKNYVDVLVMYSDLKKNIKKEKNNGSK